MSHPYFNGFFLRLHKMAIIPARADRKNKLM